MDRPTRSLQISYGPKVQQQENRTVRKSRLPSDGQITELRIRTTLSTMRKGNARFRRMHSLHVRLSPYLISQSIQLMWSLPKRTTFKLKRDAVSPSAFFNDLIELTVK